MTHALGQISRTLASTAERFPHYTEDGQWITTDDGKWTGGMWVGQLWIAYHLTEDKKYLKAALDLLPTLESRIARSDANFDLGFLLVPSFVSGYRVLGERWLRDVALRGADRMLDYINEKTASSIQNIQRGTHLAIAKLQALL